MSALDWYGLAGSALVLLAFYFLRDVSAYIKACIAIVVATGVAAFVSLGSAEFDALLRAAITTVGLGLCAFGLLFVRVMFIRSVSLNLLRSIQNGSAGGFNEDIGGRLGDMRTFRLIESRGEVNTLTGFGRLVSGFVALFYAVLRVKV